MPAPASISEETPLLFSRVTISGVSATRDSVSDVSFKNAEHHGGFWVLRHESPFLFYFKMDMVIRMVSVVER